MSTNLNSFNNQVTNHILNYNIVLATILIKKLIPFHNYIPRLSDLLEHNSEVFKNIPIGPVLLLLSLMIKPNGLISF